MSRVLMILVYQIPCAICVGFAGALAITDRIGWGWFLLIAVLLHVTVSFGEKGDAK